LSAEGEKKEVRLKRESERKGRFGALFRKIGVDLVTRHQLTTEEFLGVVEGKRVTAGASSRDDTRKEKEKNLGKGGG